MSDGIMYHSLQSLGKAWEEGEIDLARTEDVRDSDVEILDWLHAHECDGRWLDALAFQADLNTWEEITSRLWHLPATDTTPERYVIQLQPKAVKGDVAVMRAQAPGGKWFDVELPPELWMQEFSPSRRLVGLDEDGRPEYSVVHVTKEYRRKGQVGFINPSIPMWKEMNINYDALLNGRVEKIKFSYPPMVDEQDIVTLDIVTKRLVKLAEENGKRGEKYRLPILKVLAIDLETGLVTNSAAGATSAETRRMSEMLNQRAEKDRFVGSDGEPAPYDGPKVDQMPMGWAKTKKVVVPVTHTCKTVLRGKKLVRYQITKAIKVYSLPGTLVHPEYCEDMLEPILEDSSGPVWSEGAMDVGSKMSWVFTWGEVPLGNRRFLKGVETDDGRFTGPNNREFVGAMKEFLRQHGYALAMNNFRVPKGKWEYRTIPGRRLVTNPVLTGDEDHSPAMLLQFERKQGGHVPVWVTARGKVYARHPDVVQRDRKPLALWKVGWIPNADTLSGSGMPWLNQLLAMDRTDERFEIGVEHIRDTLVWKWDDRRIWSQWVEYYIPLSILDPYYLDQLGLDAFKLANWTSSKGKVHPVQGVIVRVFGDHVHTVRREGEVPMKRYLKSLPIREPGSEARGTYLPFMDELPHSEVVIPKAVKCMVYRPQAPAMIGTWSVYPTLNDDDRRLDSTIM